jgi:hypothetical protein
MLSRRMAAGPAEVLGRKMTRSVHTDPIDIRAARRLTGPHDRRSLGDSRVWRRPARRTGLNGTVRRDGLPRPARSALTTRIIHYAPGEGYAHPAGRDEVRRFLDQLPARYRYKLHAIELRPVPPAGSPTSRPLGRLLPDGRVILYAQPHSPWVLGGLLTDHEQTQLTQAGAEVSMDRRSCLTIVTWPADRLRDFMLQDVLLHELAHHLLQVRRAKSPIPATRASDHEAYAIGMTHRQATRLARRAPECA